MDIAIGIGIGTHLERDAIVVSTQHAIVDRGPGDRTQVDTVTVEIPVDHIDVFNGHVIGIHDAQAPTRGIDHRNAFDPEVRIAALVFVPLHVDHHIGVGKLLAPMAHLLAGDDAPACNRHAVAPDLYVLRIEHRPFVDIERLPLGQDDNAFRMLTGAIVAHIAARHRRLPCIRTARHEEQVVVAGAVELDRHLAFLIRRKREFDRIAAGALLGRNPVRRRTYGHTRKSAAFFDLHTHGIRKIVGKERITHRIAQFLGVVPVVPYFLVMVRGIGTKGIAHLDGLPAAILEHVYVVIGIRVPELVVARQHREEFALRQFTALFTVGRNAVSHIVRELLFQFREVYLQVDRLPCSDTLPQHHVTICFRIGEPDLDPQFPGRCLPGHREDVELRPRAAYLDLFFQRLTERFGLSRSDVKRIGHTRKSEYDGSQRIGGIYQYHLHGRGKRFERKTLAYLLPRRALHPNRRDFGVDILYTQDILGRVRPGGGVRKREVVLRGECERRRPVAGCFDPPHGSLAGSHFHLRTAVVVEAEDSLRPGGDPVRSIPVLSVVIGIEGKRIVLGAGCRTEDRRKRECRPNLVFHRIVFLSV